MNCSTQITHTIKLGDTLFSLARTYDTTVSKLLELNPGVEVYNLQIGSTLIICQPETPPVTPVPPIGTIPNIDNIRELLLYIIKWVRENFGEQSVHTILSMICRDLNH